MWIPYEETLLKPRNSTPEFVFHHMPPYLSADQFSDWYRKINNLAKNIGLPNSVASDLIITFSDEEKAHTFGSLSLEEAKEKVRTKWEIDKNANDILDSIQTPEDFHESQLASPLAEAISAANHDQNETYESVRAQLENIFAMVAFKQLILGEYIHPKVIVLYTKNIEHTQHTPNEKRTLAQIYETTFAHEMFHAYHYQNEPEELIARTDYTSCVVKESLASAFEWDYCVENTIPNADDLRYEWARYSVITYPYSGAKHLLQPVPHRAMVCLDKPFFCDVFHTSLVDMDRALRILVPDEFYRIKKLIHYREKKVMSTDLRAAFDALMKQDKISVIAQREIPSIIRQTKNRRLIPQLMDLNYSNKYFHATQYPILATAPILDGAGREKSYADPVLRIGKTNYYLTAQWNKDHLDLLLDWIWQHR